MTPNNIVNMAVLKGLNVITVSDHNCADHAPVISSLAAEAGLICVPGIEMTSAEEVHILAFFASAKEAVTFGDYLYDSLPNVPNNSSFFGNQYIMNERDEIIGEKQKLLLTALPFDFSQCCTLAREAGGVVVPAHVNKEANSVLANLGFFPEPPEFATIEVRLDCSQAGVDARFQQIHSSDAHALEFMAEPEHELELESFSVDSVLKLLRN